MKFDVDWSTLIIRDDGQALERQIEINVGLFEKFNLKALLLDSSHRGALVASLKWYQ